MQQEPLNVDAGTEEASTPQANGRLYDLTDVIRACQDREIPAYVVGRWVWASFPSKPSAEIRSFLKATGFRYNDNRKAWMHNCGYRTKQAKGYDPRDKYGTVPVSQFNLDDKEASK